MFDRRSCDVEDKEKLALFRNRRSYWKRLLLDDDFSIDKQVMDLLWKDAIFRSLNEARKLRGKSSPGISGMNAALLNLLDRGFVDSQVMAIRRMTDRTFHDPSKSVISLPSIIDDIELHSDLVTRENYICYNGLPYDEPPFESGTDQFHWSRMQEYFDKLSGVSSDHRSRQDLISQDSLKRLLKKLDVCQGVRKYANKFIAHTADELSRSVLPSRDRGITLRSLDSCMKSIVSVGSYTGVVILYEHGLGKVPTPQFNQFENLEKAMATAEDLDRLHDFWQERAREVETWSEDLNL